MKLTGYESSVLCFLAQRPLEFDKFKDRLDNAALEVAISICGIARVGPEAEQTARYFLQWARDRARDHVEVKPPPMPPAKTPADVLNETVARTIDAVARAVAPCAPAIDANPKGLDAVVLAASLRAYADMVEHGFEEGNRMGPLKTTVDELRQRMLKEFLAR